MHICYSMCMTIYTTYQQLQLIIELQLNASSTLTRQNSLCGPQAGTSSASLIWTFTEAPIGALHDDHQSQELYGFVLTHEKLHLIDNNQTLTGLIDMM